MSYNDPTLRARINSTCRESVHERNHGKNRDYTEHLLGLTKVHIEQGLVYAQIGWGVDGNDLPISPDVENFVEMFDVSSKITLRADGIYKLRDKKRKIVATARVQPHSYSNDKSEIYVSGKDRKDVVKLYELIRDGKVRPDIEHEEFEQVEGTLNELRRLRRQVPALEHQVVSRDETIASLKKQLKTVRVELAEAQAAAAAWAKMYPKPRGNARLFLYYNLINSLSYMIVRK